MIYPKIRLDKVCRITMGQAPSGDSYNSDGEGLALIAGAGDFGKKTPEPKKFTTAAGKKSEKGEIILCIRATIGDLNWSDKEYCLGRGVAGLFGHKDKLDQKYLWYWLTNVAPILKSKGKGATFLQVTKEDICSLEIPLPLLEEQRRIASILDKADELRQKRQQAIEKLDQLLQATFIDMFGDPILNTKNWPLDKKLGDIADIVSGITKGRKITGKSLREIPYLAVSNVQDKYLNLSVIKTIEASDEEIERYKLQQGDLLLTEGGDPDKLGRGTLWNNEVDECIHQNHVFRVRLTSKDFTPNYLNWIVGSEYGKRYFLKSAKQTTGIASINMGQLKKLPLLIPPLDLQIQFDERCNKFHQIKKQLAESYKDINNLFKSLQNQAFSGNL
ncbi:restriction endonuclease subunit S [Acinetobacter sp. YH12134]|uniref:restriction endonuclease subunit S n=1 Tax=Acinetobacter sp. YH12134 TaxID=2601118 RepID=UPI00359FE9F9